MSKNDLASEILDGVGGASNVELLTNCATRLRFTLKDASIVDNKKVDSIKGVLGTVPQGDKSYQVVIGGGVQDVCEKINSLIEDKSSSSTKKSNDDIKAAEREKIKGKNKILDTFFEFLSDSFRPIIGVLLGASLIIAILNLMKTFNVISSEADTPSTLFLSCIAQSVFYFLPVLIAYNASKKLRIDPWVGAVCMLALLTPQFLALSAPEMYKSIFGDGPGLQNALQSLESEENPFLGKGGTAYVTHIFNLPMVLLDYKGNVFVPLVTSGFLALLYKGLKKIIPSSVQLVFVPFISMLITVPFVAFVIGPICVFAGNYLGVVLSWLNYNAPFVFAVSIPLLYPFLVPLGLHWPLNALMLLNIDTLGYDFIQGPMGCWNFACFGATFGVLVHALKERDNQMSSTAGGALAAGLLGGVSEPSLYGIHLRYKKIYPRLLAGCAAGGLTIAVLGTIFKATESAGVTTTSFAFTSLLTIPNFERMWVYAISITIAFCVSAACVILFDYRTKEEKSLKKALNAAERLGVVDIEVLMRLSKDQREAIVKTFVKNENSEADEINTIYSPISGKTISLKQTGDDVFASKALGEGLAIQPDVDSSSIISPVNGEIKSVSPANHAITIMSDTGIGVLIHIGLETINVGGKGLASVVSAGDKVKIGDELVKVDFKAVKDSGVDNCPIVVTVVNSNIMSKVEPNKAGDDISAGDDIIKVIN